MTAPTTFVAMTVVPAGPVATMNAVFESAVGAQTTPMFPLIVNVVVVPGRNVNPVPLHMNRVPDATFVTTGAAHPAGVPATAFTMTGETVSTTVRFVIVWVLVFVTTIWNVTGEPIPGAAGFIVLTAVTASPDTDDRAKAEAIRLSTPGVATVLRARTSYQKVSPAGIAISVYCVAQYPTVASEENPQVSHVERKTS
jgi:hypothetical protein